MVIFLVQHGLCFDKATDPTRSLSPEGRLEITKIARQAADCGITVNVIYHSGKLRAQQTAELFAGPLQAGRIESINGLNPSDDVGAFVDNHPLPDRTMLVGHLPFMERLASLLIAGRPEPNVVKFQNAGIVCLEQNETHDWHVKWTIMPVIE